MKSAVAGWIDSLEQDLGRLGGIFSTSTARTRALHPGERRTVAVLFMDLEGFREMSGMLDHEVFHKIGSSVMSGLSRLVEFHGGHVDKIEGERIMALFGAERAHENDCVRAVSCATRMLEVVEEFGGVLSEQGFPVGARAGVSYGDVTVAPDPSGHTTATGDEVNTASRLEEMADTGTVAVTAAVRNGAGEQFEWVEIGEVPVKGKKKPVSVFRPTGPGRTQTDRWERASRLASVPFVGRNTELSNLRILLEMQSAEAERNRRGGAKHIFAGIRGNAGIGKSRLIHEFERELDDATVLKAGCASYAQPPMWLMVSLVRGWLGIGPAEFPGEGTVAKLLDGKLSGLGGASQGMRDDSRKTIVELLSGTGDDSRAGTEGSPDSSRMLVHSALADLFRFLSGASGRLVVILDDVHWVDSASREALESIATGCDTDMPILFILMYRPQPTPGLELMEGLSPDYTVSRETRLKEIDPDSSRELILHLLVGEGGDETGIPDQVVDFLIRSSGGNAFFIEELVLGMIESGLLSEDGEGQWALSAPPESMVVPGSIKGLVRARTDHLPQDARRLLQVASVLGEEFGTDVLFGMAGKVGLGAGVEEAFDSLVDRCFLESDGSGTVRFGHALVRDAVVETILKRNRRLLHSMIADDMEERAGQDPNMANAIARHRADAGEVEKGIPWAVLAQQHAEERYDGAAVVYWSNRLEEWLGERLESPDDAAMLVQVLMKCQNAQGLALDLGGQEATLAKIVGLIGEWRLEGHRPGYLMALGSMHSRSGDARKALELFGQALELFTASDDRAGIARALSDIALSKRQLGNTNLSSELLGEAITLFRELGDTGNTARALLRRASAQYHLGLYEEAIESIDEGMALAGKAGVRTVEGNLVNLRGIIQVAAQDYEGAISSQNSALAISREVGDRTAELAALNSMCNALHRLHRYEEGMKVGLEALQASRELGDRRTEANVLCGLGLNEWGKHRHDEAYDYFRQSLEAHERIGNLSGQAAVHWNLGIISLNLLDFDRILEHTDRSFRLYLETGNRSKAASKLAYIAMILADMGRTAEAAATLDRYDEEFGDIANRFNTVRLVHARADIAFRNGEYEKAMEGYRRSVELAEASGTPELVGQSLQKTGLILLELGRDDEAMEYLEKGYRTLIGVEYMSAFLACAEYLYRSGETEEAASQARQAYEHAMAAGNEKDVKRAAEILMELGHRDAAGGPGQ